MSRLLKSWKWRAAALAVALIVVGLPVAILGLLSSGLVDNGVRRVVVRQVERITGGAVELRQFHINPWLLLVTLDDLTVHGREPSGTPPFLHVDHLVVQLQIDSIWRRKISLADLEIVRPAVHVRIEDNGSSNVPLPKPSTPSGKPFRQRIFDLAVGRLRLEDGNVLFNDVHIPLVAEGGGFEFALDYSDAQGRPNYMGDLNWQQFTLAARRYLPFTGGVLARFTLEPDAFSLTQLVLTMPHTSLDAQLSLSSFVHPAWSFRYRGHLDFQDIRTILRKPTSPAGRVDFLGNGQFADTQLALTGHYSAEAIAFPFEWFHATGIASTGTYHADSHKLDVPDFQAHALGGVINGTVHLDFDGLRFRTDTHGQSIDLPSLFAAVDNDHLPVLPLHWNGVMDIRAVTTWNADFKNLDSRGVSLWAPPAELRAGQIPVTARLNYHYSMLNNNVSIDSSEISTPTSRVQMNGVLGAHDSDLEALFDSRDIVSWDDFINRLRGKNAEPKIVSGNFQWQGRLTGPLNGPTFAGHVKGANARYDRLYWDEVEGDMTYSPDGFQFVRANARRGGSSAQFELALTLDDWSFRPESPWSFDATLVRTETDGLQSLFDTSYPAHGLLSGTFHGSGTRAEPQMKGLFDIIAPEAWGWKLDRARGEISLDGKEVQISNAELRLLPPAASSRAPAAAPGLLTGNFRYGLIDRQATFNLTGALLPLEGIDRIQTARLPIGGRLSFQLSGQGPLLAPKLTGSLRLVDLRLGSDVIGSFQSQIDSDGSRVTVQMDSAMAAGTLHGQMQMALSGDYPLTGQLSVTQLNLNPLISAALRLNALTSPSSVDGTFAFSGPLLRPDTLEMQAELTHIKFDYEYVSLENNGPVRFQYRRNEITVAESDFRGPDSDFRVTGLARFAGDLALDLHVGGEVNLRLLDAFVSNLAATGPAQVDAGIAGTLSNPRVTGQVHLQGASIRYGDFPTGLSGVTGNFIFDSTRLLFSNVTSQVGGGNMVLAGLLSYGNGQARYDVSAQADQVRIRYPVGMSWHANGTLRLSGTAQGATLSGHISVDRLLMADNFDILSLLGSPSEAVATPLTTSAFLRNLELDVQADTTPNAVLEWPGGSFQTEANVRLHGTWQRPVLLGNIHMLNGQMEFHGNRFQLTRGDIDFTNPFRIDPVLNVEATTRVQQYEITVNFSGAASHLTMSYRSEPPLPPNDVITLLALGQTGEESNLRGLTAVQTPETGATTLLSEAISSQLGGRVQRLFGISHFSVDPFLGDTAIGPNTTPRVTVQQQFSPNLTVTYVTNVNSTQEQVIQIEYTVRPDISIEALRDENGTFGIDIIFRKHFK